MKSFMAEFSDFLRYESRLGRGCPQRPDIDQQALLQKGHYIRKVLGFASSKDYRFTFFIRSKDIEKKFLS